MLTSAFAVCDINRDHDCDLADLDTSSGLYGHPGFPGPIDPNHFQFDVNADGVLDVSDLSKWLKEAASFDEFQLPYLPGDTDLDRDVDITDFSKLAREFNAFSTDLKPIWEQANFDGDADVDITDFNQLVMNYAPLGYNVQNCDFNRDTLCDLVDLSPDSGLYSDPDFPDVLNVGEARFDINEDGFVNLLDLVVWLEETAKLNGFDSAYLPGDTDFDRDVDTTDFTNFTSSFSLTDELIKPLWEEGNFDGDFDVDVTDFAAIVANFSVTGYFVGNAPEPSSLISLMIGVLLLRGLRGTGS